MSDPGKCSLHQPLTGIIPQFAAAPGIFTYTSNVSNATYTFNTFKDGQAAAQSYCVDLGGHLVAYRNEKEQVLVTACRLAGHRPRRGLCKHLHGCILRLRSAFPPQHWIAIPLCWPVICIAPGRSPASAAGGRRGTWKATSTTRACCFPPTTSSTGSACSPSPFGVVPLAPSRGWTAPSPAPVWTATVAGWAAAAGAAAGAAV